MEVPSRRGRWQSAHSRRRSYTAAIGVARQPTGRSIGLCLDFDSGLEAQLTGHNCTSWSTSRTASNGQATWFRPSRFGQWVNSASKRFTSNRTGRERNPSFPIPTSLGWYSVPTREGIGNGIHPCSPIPFPLFGNGGTAERNRRVHDFQNRCGSPSIDRSSGAEQSDAPNPPLSPSKICTYKGEPAAPLGGQEMVRQFGTDRSRSDELDRPARKSGHSATNRFGAASRSVPK